MTHIRGYWFLRCAHCNGVVGSMVDSDDPAYTKPEVVEQWKRAGRIVTYEQPELGAMVRKCTCNGKPKQLSLFDET